MLERAPAFEEVGAGLQIGPNAARALEVLGAWEDVSPIASAPPAILMQDAKTGRQVRRIDLGKSFSTRFGAPYRVAHRADLHSALLACARQSSLIRVAKGEDVIGLEQDGNEVRVTTARNSRHVGDMLIAADGMNSGLRQKLWPGSTAVHAGQILHRALVEMPGGMRDGDCVKLWMGPGYHVVHYPVGVPARLNIICVAHVGQSPRDVSAITCPELKDLIQAVPEWLPWEAKHVPPLAQWHKGRVMLLGDAAHGTVPYFAQGAAMALEDAALLLSALQKGAEAGDVVASVGLRLPRVRAVHSASVRHGKIYGASGVVALGRNAILRLIPEATFLARLAWLYDDLPTLDPSQ